MDDEKHQVRTFASELVRLRALTGESQSEVAAAIEVSQAALSHWESGKRPSPLRVRQLEHHFQVEPGSLESLVVRRRREPTAQPPRVIQRTASSPRRRRRVDTDEITNAESVALILSGHTKETFDAVLKELHSLQSATDSASKELAKVSATLQSMTVGSDEYMAMIQQVQRLNDVMRENHDKVAVTIDQVKKVDELRDRMKFVLGRSRLAEKAVDATRPTAHQLNELPADVFLEAMRQRDLRRTAPLRRSYFFWKKSLMTSDDGPANEHFAEVVGAMYKRLMDLQGELTETNARLHEVRSMVNHPSRPSSDA